MFVFTEEKAVLRKSEWGREVTRRLAERKLQQLTLAMLVRSEGFPKFDRDTLNKLMHGVRVSTHWAEIHAINRILGIPEAD